MAALAHDPAALEEAQSVVQGAHMMLESARQQVKALEKVTKPLEQVHPCPISAHISDPSHQTLEIQQSNRAWGPKGSRS